MGVVNSFTGVVGCSFFATSGAKAYPLRSLAFGAGIWGGIEGADVLWAMTGTPKHLLPGMKKIERQYADQPGS